MRVSIDVGISVMCLHEIHVLGRSPLGRYQILADCVAIALTATAALEKTPATSICVRRLPSRFLPS